MKIDLVRRLDPATSGFTLLLGLMAGLPALSIDLSAPTLAILPSALDTSVFVAGLSLSSFLLGFGVGQFAGGRSSDRLGRRPVLIAALSTYALAGICCMFATSGGQLATARLIQGVGAGGCSVQAFAIVQDLFVGEAARRKQAYVSVVLTVMPMLAPALGALVMLTFGWRAVHSIMAAGGIALVTTIYFLVRESLPTNKLLRSGLGFADSAAILRDPLFRRVTVVNALSYASIFTYIAGAPVVIIAQYDLGALAYAAVFACTAAALSGGAFTSARLANRLDCRRLVEPALVTQAACNIGLLLFAVTELRRDIWLLLPLLIASCYARGIIAPNMTHAAISGHRQHAGLAAALLGLAQLALAAISSAVLARLLGAFGIVALATAMAILTTAAVALWILTDLGALIAGRDSLDQACPERSD